MSPWVVPPIKVRRWPRRTTSWKAIDETDSCVVEQYHWPKTSQKNYQNVPAPCFRIITKCTPHLKVFQSRDQIETNEALLFLKDDILPCIEGRITSAKIAIILRNVAPWNTASTQSLPDITPNRESPTKDPSLESPAYLQSESPEPDELTEPEATKRWALENDPPTNGISRFNDDDTSKPQEPSASVKQNTGRLKGPLRRRWRLSKSGGTSSGVGAHDHEDDFEEVSSDDSSSSWEDLANPSSGYPSNTRLPGWLAWFETIQNNSDGASRSWSSIPFLLLNLLLYPEVQATNGRPRIQDLRERHMVRQRRRVLSALTLYCIILRFCSFDAFMIIMVVTNGILLYLMKNSRKINVGLAKRKVRRQVGWAKTWAGGFFGKRRISPSNGGVDEVAEGQDGDARPNTNVVSTSGPNSTSEPLASRTGAATPTDKGASGVVAEASTSRDALASGSGSSSTNTGGNKRKRLLGLSRRSQSATTTAGSCGPLTPASAVIDNASGAARMRIPPASSPPSLIHTSTMPNGSSTSIVEERSIFHRRKRSIETPILSTVASRRISNPVGVPPDVPHEQPRPPLERAVSQNWGKPPSYREFEDT